MCVFVKKGEAFIMQGKKDLLCTKMNTGCHSRGRDIARRRCIGLSEAAVDVSERSREWQMWSAKIARNFRFSDFFLH